MTDHEIRAELLRVTRQAYFQDRMFAATSGNLSIYDRASGRMYITPSTYPYEQMTEEDMMVIDLEGRVLEGRHRPSSEWALHAQLHKGFEDCCAVVHTHSPYATAFAINNMEIPVVLYEMVTFIGGSIPCAPRAIPHSPGVGGNVIRTLREKPRTGCLMGNHGAVAFGKTLAQAYTRATYIEDAAKAYSIALTHGPVVTIDRDEVEAVLKEGIL